MAAPLTTPGAILCEDPRLTGVHADDIVGRLPGCGIYQPVRLRAIAGVKLSSAAVLDCRTARNLANWVTGIAQPAARQLLTARLEKLWIMGTYSCRTRNNRVGARVSEHGAGRAIDIGGMWLGNGTRITVANHWGEGAPGAFLSQIRERACGMFTTVLGPGSDRYHTDHLHLDMAYRERAHCR